MNMRRAFSLVELLVAIAILATVAGIVVPRFLDIRNQAIYTGLSSNQSSFNSLYAEWASMGGTITCSNFPIGSTGRQTRMAFVFLRLMVQPTTTSSVTSLDGGTIATDGSLPVRLAGWKDQGLADGSNPWDDWAWTPSNTSLYDDGNQCWSYNPNSTVTTWGFDDTTSTFHYYCLNPAHNADGGVDGNPYDGTAFLHDGQPFPNGIPGALMIYTAAGGEIPLGP